LDLDGTQYDENDHWVVRYSGMADIVELSIDVARVSYVVAAAGVNLLPITTPPVFDQLLERELKEIAALLSGGKRGRMSIRRQAKRLFTAFRGLTMLDKGLKSVAKLGKDATANPAPAVVRAAEGFISVDAAVAIATAIRHTLDKVSPAYSCAAWAVVALLPATISFVYAAESISESSLRNPWQALLLAIAAAASAAAAMLAVSPAGWFLSATVSSIMRLAVPTEYRQRGRNWAPLMSACVFAMSASFVGALYGGASVVHWVPNMRDVATPVLAYAAAHVPLRNAAGVIVAGQATGESESTFGAAVATSNSHREIQRFLIAHGYLRGLADGNFGPRTVEAITRYKRHEGLGESVQLPEVLAHMRATIQPVAVAGNSQAVASSLLPTTTNMLPARTAVVPRQVSAARVSTVMEARRTDAPTYMPCKDDGTFFGSNICKSPVLAASYQRELGEYEAAQKRLGVIDNGMRIEQEHWLQTVTRDCTDANCLTSAFSRRTAELNGRYRAG
jgi:hypothetical protein